MPLHCTKYRFVRRTLDLSSDLATARRSQFSAVERDLVTKRTSRCWVASCSFENCLNIIFVKKSFGRVHIASQCQASRLVWVFEYFRWMRYIGPEYSSQETGKQVICAMQSNEVPHRATTLSFSSCAGCFFPGVTDNDVCGQELCTPGPEGYSCGKTEKAGNSCTLFRMLSVFTPLKGSGHCCPGADMAQISYPRPTGSTTTPTPLVWGFLREWLVLEAKLSQADKVTCRVFHPPLRQRRQPTSRQHLPRPHRMALHWVRARKVGAATSCSSG